MAPPDDRRRLARAMWVVLAALPAGVMVVGLSAVAGGQGLLPALRAIGGTLGALALSLALLALAWPVDPPLRGRAGAALRWFMDPRAGAARVLALALALGALVLAADAVAAWLLTRHRHAGLLVAVWSAAAAALAALAALAFPALVTALRLPLRALGAPSPIAALLVVAVAVCGALATSPRLRLPGLLALYLALLAGWAWLLVARRSPRR